MREALRDRYLVLLVLIAIVFSMISAFMHKDFNPYDESAHFIYIQELHHHKRIPSYLHHDVSVGCVHSVFAKDCVPGNKCYQKDKHLERNEISIHSPLYYLLNLPLYRVLEGNVCHALIGARLFNSLIFVAVLGLLYILLSRFFDRPLAFLSVLWILTNPNLLARGSAVTDDVLPAFFSLIGVLVLLKKPLTFRRIALSGCLAGLSFVSKYTAYLVCPVLCLFAAALIYSQTKKKKDCLSAVAVFFVAAMIPIAIQMSINHSIYGQVFYQDMRGSMGEASIHERLNIFLDQPHWLYRWFMYYWIDSWTSFYDWTSGYVYTAQKLHDRHLLPIGKFYLAIGAVLLIFFVHTLYSCRRKIKQEEFFLIALGLAAPISKFVFDFHTKTPFPAIRFGFPYLAGLGFLLPFMLSKNRLLKGCSVWFASTLVLMNLLQLIIGFLRNYPTFYLSELTSNLF